MQKQSLILGIDTSNYKTSVALCDLDGNIIGDRRRLLKVNKGDRGLRQSHALFQHVENLPKVMNELMSYTSSESEIVTVAVSSKPRPLEGSYMPCFNAGVSTAQSIASVLGVPCILTSHQEGHIASISYNANVPDEFLALHLSGGTCELLRVFREKGSLVEDVYSKYKIEIVGGSKDISFGQVLDRLGVSMGMDFPSGIEMDAMAQEATNLDFKRQLSKVKVNDSYFNLSGLETQAQRILEDIESSKLENYTKENLVVELFDTVVETIQTAVYQKLKSSNLQTVLFAGGVSSSIYISKKLKAFGSAKGYRFEFGNQAYSSDNAVGVSFIGLEAYKTIQDK